MPSAPRPKYLYRTIAFEHVVDIFRTSELHFSSPRRWQDPYENISAHARSGAVFAQCWSSRAESDAIWRIYSPNRDAVRLRVTRRALSSALSAARKAYDLDTFVKRVTYVPAGRFGQRLEDLGRELHQRFDLKTAVEALCLKRKAFDHECEVRVVVHARKMSDSGAGPQSLRIKVDPHALIDQITFDPRVSDAMARVFWHYLREALRFNGHLGRSLLYRPESITVA